MLKAIWENKNGKTVMNNYMALLFIQGANFILPLIAFPYLVRTLGAERYGLVMIAQSLGVFLSIIVDFGFNISATREVSLVRQHKEKLSQLYWNVFFIKFCLILISFSIVVFLISFVERFEIEPWVYLFSFGIVLGQAIFPTWFFQGIERMRMITIINVIAKIFFTVCLFIFVLEPSDYEIVPLLNGLGFILAGIVGLGYSLKYVYLKKPKILEIKVLIGQSSSLFVSNLATSLYTASNTFILGMVAGDAIAGIYSSMEKLVVAIKNMYVPLYQAIFPWLSTKPHTGIRSVTKKMVLPIGISGAIITLVFFVFAKPILHLVYDNQLIENYSQILQILSFIALFSALNMLFVTLFFPSIKAYKKRMYAMVAGGIFNIIAALILVHFNGIYGIAISAAAAELFILIVAIYFFKYHKKSVK